MSIILRSLKHSLIVEVLSFNGDIKRLVLSDLIRVLHEKAIEYMVYKTTNGLGKQCNLHMRITGLNHAKTFFVMCDCLDTCHKPHLLKQYVGICYTRRHYNTDGSYTYIDGQTYKCVACFNMIYFTNQSNINRR
jgi:hypothetical protein